MGILDRIGNLQELDPWLKVLVYGEPGSGKTVFACGAPKPLLVDCDHDGHVSLANHPDLAEKVQILQVETFNDLDEVFWEFRKGNIPGVETIILDTVSELQRRNMDELLIRQNAKDSSRNAFLPQQGNYKENTEMMRRLMTSFRDLECNLVVVAHRIEDKDDNGRIYVRPEVTPKLASTMKGLFSIQGYMTFDVEKFKTDDQFVNSLQIRQSRKVEAKTRVGGLPSDISNPSFQMLLDAYEAQRERVHQMLAEQADTTEAVPSTS